MRIQKTYSKEFKEAAVQKLLAVNSKGPKRIAEEIGIPLSTLYCWKYKCVTVSQMKDNKIKNWTPEKKLEAIIKTASMTEHELGEYLRAQGLYSADLERWKKDCTDGLRVESGRPKKDPEVFELRKKEQELESELRRKDKALAEVTARVILLKKSHLLFGKDEGNS